MVKINTLSYFLFLRILGIVLIVFLELSNSFTINYLWKTIILMTPLTLFVLKTRFTENKKNEKYNISLTGWYFFLISILFLFEFAFVIFVPLGYFSFELVMSLNIGIEIVLSFVLGVFKKINLEKLLQLLSN